MFRSYTLAFAAACALAPNLTRADVVTYDFTGRISHTILQSGIPQTFPSVVPDSWVGQLISGSIRMDFGLNGPNIGSTYSQIGSVPDPQWLTITLHQPDGQTLVVPSGPALGINLPPGFCGECNDAYSYVMNGWRSPNDPTAAPQDAFYVQRTLINGLEPFPRQHFSINLQGLAVSQAGLTDSTDYRQIHVDPSFANVTNYGYVEHIPTGSDSLVYSFTVLSLTSQVAAVPEPGVFVLAGIGAGVIFLVRRRKQRPQTGDGLALT